MIARPARVRIRSRKPWVLDRRRLFGWNVRLLTRYSYCTTSAVACPPADGHARGIDPGSWFPARTTGRQVGTCAEPRALSQTPTSIAEDRRPPAAARAVPAFQAAPRAADGHGGTPWRRPGKRHPTRRGTSEDRCPPVDEAVSVAVAPRRAEGSGDGVTRRSHRRSRSLVRLPDQGSDQHRHRPPGPATRPA